MLNKLSAAALALAACGASHADSAAYGIDPTHTFVYFEAGHFGTSTLRGRFDKKEGKVSLDRAAHAGSAEITIDMKSVNTGVPALDQHLASADFFNTPQYPTATFSADQFTFSGDQVSGVAGKLTLLGKTQPVTLKALRFNCYISPLFKREVCGGDFETTLARSAYGITYGIPAVPDEIRLTIQIEAIKQ